MKQYIGPKNEYSIGNRSTYTPRQGRMFRDRPRYIGCSTGPPDWDRSRLSWRFSPAGHGGGPALEGGSTRMRHNQTLSLDLAEC
jgi:hypothetical protein